MTPIRAVAAVRTAAGVVLLARPHAVAAAVRGDRAPQDRLVRLLGARLVAQGVLEWVRPGRAVVMTGAGVDAAHGLSMVAVVVVFPGYRRPALLSAAAAAGFAAAALAAVRRR